MLKAARILLTAVCLALAAALLQAAFSHEWRYASPNNTNEESIGPVPQYGIPAQVVRTTP